MAGAMQLCKYFKATWLLSQLEVKEGGKDKKYETWEMPICGYTGFSTVKEPTSGYDT